MRLVLHFDDVTLPANVTVQNSRRRSGAVIALLCGRQVACRSVVNMLGPQQPSLLRVRTVCRDLVRLSIKRKILVSDRQAHRTDTTSVCHRCRYCSARVIFPDKSHQTGITTAAGARPLATSWIPDPSVRRTCADREIQMSLARPAMRSRSSG